MLILFAGATVIACCGATLFQAQENWSYFDSQYHHRHI